MTREALYEGVLPPRRRLWHRRTAEALSAQPDADPDAVAYHFEQAGDPRAAEWLIRAGERAQRAYAWLTAGERFAMAAELLSGVPGEERTRARTLCRVARVLRFATPAEGLPAVEEAIRLAERVGDAALAAEARQTRGLLLCYSDDYAHGCDDMEAGTAALEALATGEDDGTLDAEDWLADALPAHALAGEGSADPARAVLAAAGIHHRRGILSVCLAYAGRYAEALAMGERFLAVVGDITQTSTLVRAACAHTLHGMAVAHAAMGRSSRRGRSSHARARPTTSWITMPGSPLLLLNELHTAVLPYCTTDSALRARLASAAEAALHRSGGALPPELSPRLGRVACSFLNGEWDAVRAILGGDARPGQFLAPAGGHRHARDPCPPRRQARPRLVPDRLPSDRRPSDPTRPADLHRGAAPACALPQTCASTPMIRAGARPWLEAHDRWVAWGGVHLGRADGLVCWARLHHVTGDVTRARACATDALTDATNPDQPLVLVAAHQILGRLAMETGQLATAERHLVAALELATACAAPFVRATALVALAELRLVEGQREDAGPLLAEAIAIAEVLGAAPLHAAAALHSASEGKPEGTAGFPAGLTQREVEVLQLVAEGLTDGAVAQQLFISPRTVSQHLRSIYGKLEVSSRAAATRFAVEHRLL